MIFVFYPLAALLIWFSLKSFLGGVRYLRFFRQEVSKSPSNYKPFVSIIAPCRGLDEDLDQNLAAIFKQDYPEYEIIFAIDNDADPALPVIEAAIARHPWRSAKVIVGPEQGASARKVEKLREGVLHVSDRCEVFVFVDSDTRPSPGWLAGLVAPLQDEKVGAATGYRWFISKRFSFASELRSVWNASIASALGPKARSNFTWGGSTAIRRRVFDELGIRECWKGTLSDDFALTKALRKAGRPIVFVPAALTASIENTTLPDTLEFTNRQMKITRVYMPQLWVMSFIGSSLFTGVMIWSALIVILDRDLTADIPAVITLLLVTVFSTAKSLLRWKAVRLALPQYEKELAAQFWTQNTLWLLSPVLFFVNCCAAMVSRRISWRGTTYELKSPDETVIIRG